MNVIQKSTFYTTPSHLVSKEHRLTVLLLFLTGVEDSPQLTTSFCPTPPSLAYKHPAARPEVFTEPCAAVAAGRLAGAGAGQAGGVLLELAAVTAVQGVHLHVDVLAGGAGGGCSLAGHVLVRLGSTEGVERSAYGSTHVHLRPRH